MPLRMALPGTVVIWRLDWKGTSTVAHSHGGQVVLALGNSAGVSPSPHGSAKCGFPTARHLGAKSECFKFVKVEAVQSQKLNNLTSATLYWSILAQSMPDSRGGKKIPPLEGRNSKDFAAIFNMPLLLMTSLI